MQSKVWFRHTARVPVRKLSIIHPQYMSVKSERGQKPCPSRLFILL